MSIFAGLRETDSFVRELLDAGRNRAFAVTAIVDSDQERRLFPAQHLRYLASGFGERQ